MKISYKWLKDHLETQANAKEIADKLCEIGFEVEELEDLEENLKDIKIAFVENVEKHPNADKLSVCTVNDGSEKLLQVVCGASNVRKGMITAFVNVGGIVPKYNEALKPAKIRDVESQGMLCSYEELNMENDSDGIIDLNITAKPGDSFAKAIGLDDKIFTVSVTPNRGDCFSIRGIARDLCASGIGKLKDLDFCKYTNNKNIYKFDDSKKSSIDIKIETDDCKYFYGVKVDNIKNCESPDWLKSKLASVGQKSINALVDITNFINFDLGQPSHVYDASKISGDLIIRNAKKFEKILALNDQEYELNSDMMVVSDNEKSLTIAGIMGGKESGSSFDTTSIFFEAALFDPISVSKTGQKLALTSDSRMRFERGIDSENTKTALEYAITLIIDICKGNVDGCKLALNKDYKDNVKTITIDEKKIVDYSGDESITIDESLKILQDLGFMLSSKNGNSVTLKVPSWRNDISIQEDLIEEILRIRGYSNLQIKELPLIKSKGSLEKESLLKTWFYNRGFSEVYTLPFLSSEEANIFNDSSKNLEVLSPLNTEKPFLRSSLVPSLLTIVENNQNRNYKNGAIFELESVFSKENNESIEQRMCCGLKFGTTTKHWSQKSIDVDVFEIKSDLENILEKCGVTSYQISSDSIPIYYHPGRSGVITRGREIIAYFGELHPKVLSKLNIDLKVVCFEIFANDRLFEKIGKIKPKSVNLSSLQPLKRDFAFIVDKDIPAIKIIDTALKSDKMIENVEVFDVFDGNGIENGKKSIAIQVTIQPSLKTLDEDDLINISEKITSNIFQKCGGILRNSK